MKPLIFAVCSSILCFSLHAQEPSVPAVTAESQVPVKNFTAKEAKTEVMKALKEKRIEPSDIGNLYEMIDNGKTAEAMKRLVPAGAGDWPKDKVVGWRGDGSGRFPEADPPTEWSFIPKTVSELKCSAKKPKGGGGEPMSDGCIHEWLVWGPSSKNINSEILPNEATMIPDENERAGESVWKLVKTNTGTLDLNAVMGSSTGVVYAHTNVYSGSESEFTMQLNGRDTVSYWVNGIRGEMKNNAARVTVSFKSGWNSLTFKVNYAKNTLTYQTPSGWYINPVFFGNEEVNMLKKNISWETRLPTGFGSPIVVGSKIFVESDPDLLICIKKETGTILWVRSNNLFEAATDKINAAEAPANRLKAICDGLKGKSSIEGAVVNELNSLSKQIRDIFYKADSKKYNKPGSDIGFGSLSPTSDGKNVYAWFTQAVSVCYDLDGNRKWIRMDELQQFEHGASSSPLLVDGKLIVYIRDLLALDAKTGEKAWIFKQTEMTGNNPPRYFYGSPIAAKIGGTKLIFLPDGRVLKPSDQSVVFDAPGMQGFKQIIASPIVDNGYFVLAHRTGSLQIYKLGSSGSMESSKKVDLSVLEFPRYYSDWNNASPLAVDGLIYLINCQGILTVIDEQSGSIVYRKLLDLGQFEIFNDGAARGVGVSPTLGGKYIYFFGNFGTCLVIKSGRKYEQVAKNRINALQVKGRYSNWPEKFVASPYFDGKSLFIRTEQTLYCIQESTK
ncbi:MAG: PQQ-binding-like beta-propeller repeat protein [Candidatus Firestonebacteria bacterium]